MRKGAPFFVVIIGMAVLIPVLSVAAKPADYSLFAGAYDGHEVFHYPALGLDGKGSADLKMTVSTRGAALTFARSLHVGGMNFPFSERTRFSPQRKFTSTISVPNFASFGAASGHTVVSRNQIHFTASYPMNGSDSLLVEVATIKVRGRMLTYHVVVEFASPAGIDRAAVFQFNGLRKR